MTDDSKSTFGGLTVGKGVAWLVMGLFLAATLFPIYWTLRSALSTNQGLIEQPGSVLPIDANTFNIERVVTEVSPEEAAAAGGSGQNFDLLTALRNSMIVATVVTLGQVLFSAFAAYAFARLQFRGKNLVFAMYLSALMVPPIFSLIPNFLFIRDLPSWVPFTDDQFGWINSLPGIIAPFFLMTPFAVFFLRQFFLGISKEVEEAAVLDGAGHIRRFFQVILPMASAPIFTLAILTYVTSWNEFLWPFVVGKDEDVRVLTVALNEFKAQTPGTTAPDWTGLMAASFVSSVPILVLFAIFGRRVVDSIGFSGIK